MTAWEPGPRGVAGVPVAGLVPREDAAVVDEMARVAALLARLGKGCGRTPSAGH